MIIEPEQTVFEGDTSTFTVGVELWLIVTPIEFEEADVFVAHEYVVPITHVTRSLFERLMVEYEELLVPTLVPFTFHW